MAKPKQFAHPPKKTRQAKAPAVPQTADEFQEAADHEESTGGKHRAGDPSKAGRAFVRALDLYDQGLSKHPSDFDLAYNRARLQLEITQQPALVEHVGLPHGELLGKALEAHRFALKLNADNADLLFNMAQVLTSLAEVLSAEEDEDRATELLREALGVLSTCLERQERLVEQHRVEMEGVEEQTEPQGGVALDAGEQSAGQQGDQTAVVEVPTKPSDLLDTAHASLSSLTTLVPLVDEESLQTYADLAQTLTEEKTPRYIALLPAEEQDTARFLLALDRAVFVAALADAQYGFHAIDLATYLDRLNATFPSIPAQDPPSAQAICLEAETRTDLALSALDRDDPSPDFPSDLVWQQLSLVQDLYARATGLTTDDAKARKAEAVASRADVELLRHRVATSELQLSDGVKRSAPTLLQNAMTYYKGAAQLAKADGDEEVEMKAVQRWFVAQALGLVMFGGEEKAAPFGKKEVELAKEMIEEAVEGCVEEGLIEPEVAGEVAGVWEEE